MKVYIYRELLSPSILGYYEALYRQNAFVHHYHWFNDLLLCMQSHETRNPDEADYFFIPLFLIAFQFKHVDITHFIQDCAYLDRGRHVLFASGDYGQRKKSASEGHHPGRAYPEIYGWLDDRFILVALESTQDLLPQDIAIFPYQYIDPHVRWAASPLASQDFRKDLLYSFCGAMSYPQLPEYHVRGGLLRKLEGHGRDWFVGPPEESIQAYGDPYGHGLTLFKRSFFTLCPAGFGRWSFRYIEALLLGSIPIILSDGYALPFQDYIPWEDYVIVYHESDLPGLDDYLRSFSCGRMLELQTNIVRDRYLFMRDHCMSLVMQQLESEK